MPGTVVIVEDDENLCELLAHALRAAGYTVAAAPEGVQGMILVRQHRPDLVILDFMLPAGGAPVFHKGLRGSDFGRRTAVLVLTATPEEVVARDIDMDSRTYFLSKPYKKAELLELVGQILLDAGRPAV